MERKEKERKNKKILIKFEEAANAGDLAEISYFVVKKKVPVDVSFPTQDPRRETATTTALECAAYSNQAEAVELLLAYGAQINRENEVRHS